MRFGRARLQWSLAIVALVALLALISWQGWAAPVEDETASFFAPVQRQRCGQAAEPIANLLARSTTSTGWRRRTARCVRADRAARGRQSHGSASCRSRSARAPSCSPCRPSPRSPLLPANVIIRDLTGLRTVVGLDRGREDGIAIGMAVIAAGGTLVGRVIEVRAAHGLRPTDHRSGQREFASCISRARTRESSPTGDTLGNLEVLHSLERSEVELGHIFVTSGSGRSSCRRGCRSGASRPPKGRCPGRISPCPYWSRSLRSISWNRCVVQLTIPPPDLRILDAEGSDPATAQATP